MGFWDEVREGVKAERRFAAGQSGPDLFDVAAETKPTISTPNQAQARRILWEKNAVRMSQMERNFKWMKREMKKMGLNPEDAKYLL